MQQFQIRDEVDRGGYFPSKQQQYYNETEYQNQPLQASNYPQQSSQSYPGPVQEQFGNQSYGHHSLQSSSQQFPSSYHQQGRDQDSNQRQYPQQGNVQQFQSQQSYEQQHQGYYLDQQQQQQFYPQDNQSSQYDSNHQQQMQQRAALPAYMGALLLGFAVRAVHDALGGTWLRGETIARIAAVLLPLFLAVTLAALNLADLASVAGPMLAILAVNIALTLLFCAAIVWPLLGRTHEAGVATAGLAGYGIGSTATAVAAMDAITRQRGPAPRATTIVPPTGGFLIDLTNAPVISASLRMLS
eukprot:gene36540-45060_t